MSLVLLSIAITASAVHADSAADLRAVLGKFTAQKPLRATVSLESETRGEDGPPRRGLGSVDVEHGTYGLCVIHASEDIARAGQEARMNGIDPEKPMPTVLALRDLDGIAILEAIDAASVLLRALDNAKLTKDARLPNGGKTTRQLTFAIRPKLSQTDAKHVRSVEMSLIVNLGADGIPISAESTHTVKARFFLVTFEETGTDSWTFGGFGDHLVALRHIKTQSGSGMGQKLAVSTTTTITVR